ncbi:hypothetical protein [Vallitalea okinawensis]|uniref:hypothetical protein n=1 Tax=Vallitalea okinawensis TaxID=2078660 RepID=UPI000CFCCCEF|nr:hypothetical protein [Vallitalea okinawensis]
MADDKLLNELAALANGNVNVDEYANSMLDVLRQTVQQTYIDKFASILEDYKKQSKNELGNEMQLLEAMKPFIGDGNTGQIDAMTDMFSNIIAMKKLMGDISSINGQTVPVRNRPTPTNQQSFTRQHRGVTVNEDGVYEMYNQGSLQTNNLDGINPMILMMLLLFGM